MKTALSFALVIFASIHLSGCGCSETDLDGGADGEVIDAGPFDAVVENLGETGWEDSPSPWCEPIDDEMLALDIWSEPGSVYVLRSNGDGHSNTVFYVNSGDGWRTFHFSSDNCLHEFTGTPGGDLLWGWGGTYCGLMSVTREGTEGQGIEAVHVFVVNDSLAYAAEDSGAAVGPRIMVWDGDSWGPLPGDPVPYRVEVIWASETFLFAGGDNGLILSSSDGSWLSHDTGVTDKITHVWGFSESDVWASTINHDLLHYDGTDWMVQDWPRTNCCPGYDEHSYMSEIRDLWGAGGTLFIATGCQLIMWDGVEFSVLGSWPHTLRPDRRCTGGLTPHAMWGNATDEVFLAFRGFTTPGEDCGTEYLLWWDGSEFHWF